MKNKTKQQPLLKKMPKIKADNQSQTKNGYEIDEVVSALQKGIRRNQETEALFWAAELVDINRWQYLFHRLKIISCEDIGLADPQAAILVNVVAQQLHDSKRRADEWKRWFSPDMNIVGMVVMYLCRAPKNRICDIATSLIWEKRKRGWKLEVPSYSIDQHTKRGKQKIKEEGIDPNRQFYGEGALVKNRKSVPGDDKYWKELMEIYGLTDLANSSKNEEMK